MRTPQPTDEAGMELLVITNLYPNPVEPRRCTYNEWQFKALAAIMPMTVVCPVSWTQRLRYRSQGRLAALEGCREWDGIPVRYPTYYFVPKVLAWLRGWMMTLSILRECKRVLRGRSPKAVLGAFAFPDGFAAVAIGRMAGLPAVIKVVGSDVDSLDEGGLRRRLSLWGLRRANAIVSVAPYLKDKLVEHGIAADKVSVVYNGVDSEVFRPRDPLSARAELGLAAQQRTVLFVGRLDRDKGFAELLSAEVIAACERNGAQIAIIGEGAYGASLHQQVAARSLQDRVRLLGLMNPAQIATWMGAADCLCLPSYHEGQPNVILEALSCGLPVVATRVGGIPEVVGPHNGVLVEPHRPDDLARGIQAALGRTWDRGGIHASCPAKSWAESAAGMRAAILAATREHVRR
jgi:teichuronic acid biosynthesis glycosyltransferase TuaC